MLRGAGRPVGRFNTELPGVLGVQSLPAELHCLGADDAADGSSAEQMIENIETNVPPGGAHCDEAVADVGPECEACAASHSIELPPHVKATPVVFKRVGSIGSLDGCFGNAWRGRADRGELDRGSCRTQAPVGLEGSPLAQMRRIGKRLPDFFRRVPQLSDENERPLLFPVLSEVLLYSRRNGRTRQVVFAIAHFFLKTSASAG